MNGRLQRRRRFRINRVAGVRAVDRNDLRRPARLDQNSLAHLRLPVLPVFNQIIDDFRLGQCRGVAEIFETVLGNLA